MGLKTSSIEPILGREYALILAVRPGEESAECGGLILEACARGRPPLVAIVTDGSLTGTPGSLPRSPAEQANIHERETRSAARALHLPMGRLLMFGIYDGNVPGRGPLFTRIVDAISNIMWMRDCNVICAPADGTISPDHAATHRIACEVSRQADVRLILYERTAMQTTDSDRRWHLEIEPHMQRKAEAIRAHRSSNCEVSASPIEFYSAR